ncbi:hypothetical protein CFK38_10650 [Brachybacterium vulturis]|uniref:Uncharacterized protein n=1 Tax=Brachybacterium vulturis TaxID=2017484 RepID=A0A291GPM7_9MICO|nr:hypothetical protein [Brachybacterium vulturis]ATG51924.1 hypothetical protein CFK38_10650 [Brachybacterium vulturis]
MINTSQLQGAFLQYRADQVAAEKMHDPDLTPEANRQRQTEARAAARAKLREAIPQRPDGPDPRDAVTAALAPTTADGIAVLAHQRAKVDALMDAGRNILQVIQQADVTRLAAILDAAETSERVLSSSDPEGVQAELRGAVFDRLADLGHEDAVKAAESHADQEATTAWADALEALADGQEPDGAVQSAIYRHDVAAYRGTFGLVSSPEEARTLADAQRRAAQDGIRERVAQQADRSRDLMGSDR